MRKSLTFKVKPVVVEVNFSISGRKSISSYKKILDEAKSLNADCIVLACPLCDTNLELRQADIGKKFGETYNIPIIYITELIGLAMGMKPSKLGMNKHIVSVKPVLDKIK